MVDEITEERMLLKSAGGHDCASPRAVSPSRDARKARIAAVGLFFPAAEAADREKKVENGMEYINFHDCQSGGERFSRRGCLARATDLSHSGFRKKVVSYSHEIFLNFL